MLVLVDDDDDVVELVEVELEVEEELEVVVQLSVPSRNDSNSAISLCVFGYDYTCRVIGSTCFQEELAPNLYAVS